MSEKRIAELQNELALEKRRKKDADRVGTIYERLDNAMEAWAKKLRPLEGAKVKADQPFVFRLDIYPPAGAGYRYQGLLQAYRSLSMKSPWKFKHYVNSQTTSWNFRSYYASTAEELLPDDSQLLWIAGVTFFVYPFDGQVILRSEDVYERPLATDDKLSKFRVQGGRGYTTIDAQNPKAVAEAFNTSLYLIDERLRAGYQDGLNEELAAAEADVKRLKEKIEANLKKLADAPKPIFPALVQ